jgi:hypothetical protein
VGQAAHAALQHPAAPQPQLGGLAAPCRWGQHGAAAAIGGFDPARLCPHQRLVRAVRIAPRRTRRFAHPGRRAPPVPGGARPGKAPAPRLLWPPIAPVRRGVHGRRAQRRPPHAFVQRFAGATGATLALPGGGGHHRARWRLGASAPGAQLVLPGQPHAPGQPPDAPQAMVPPTPHGATPAPAPASASAPTVPAASATSARFDLDTYKILVKPLLGGGVAVQAVG